MGRKRFFQIISFELETSNFGLCWYRLFIIFEGESWKCLPKVRVFTHDAPICRLMARTYPSYGIRYRGQRFFAVPSMWLPPETNSSLILSISPSNNYYKLLLVYWRTPWCSRVVMMPRTLSALSFLHIFVPISSSRTSFSWITGPALAKCMST